MSSSIGDRNLGGVEITGPDDAAEVVFVHGTVFNGTMWAPQREILSEEFRVITFDMPGHGTRADEPFRLETAIETLRGVIEEEATGSVHLIGISLGGYVATEFASREPETVDRLVVADGSANPIGLLGKLTYVIGKGTLLASRSGLIKRATDWLTERYVRGQDLPPEIEEEIVDAGFDLRPFGEAGLEIAGKDFRSAFAAFPGAALVVNGQWDLVMRLGQEEHAKAGEADLTVIDDAGHISNLDQSEAYTSVVARFVDPTTEISATD